MKGSQALAMAAKVVAILVLAGWIMVWIMVPTNTYRQKWRPKIQEDTNSTYFGSQGSNILIYTFPIMFASILGCLYAHFTKKSTNREIRRPTIWRRPLLVKGPLGIVSSLELAFFLMFLILVAWCFSTYLKVSFSKITSASAAKKGEKLWEAKLDSAALRLGLVGNICLAFLFFPVARGSSLLPLLGLTPESSVRYHIWIGHVVMALFTAHGLCYIVFWIATDDVSQMGKWSKVDVANIPGEIALACGLAIWATTFPRIRRKMFELFFYTHHLYVLFLLFFLLHVGISFFCLVLPGVYLFMLDRYLRFLQSRRRIRLLSARLLPGENVELNFARHPEWSNAAASVVFVNVPSISRLQWHPFTVSSSCGLEPERLSVVVKKEGSWTGKLFEAVASAPSSLDVSLEGPYGHLSNDYFTRYDSLVLISGGGGITPFISMIRELIHAAKSPNYPSPAVHLVCAFKTSTDLSLLSLLLPSSGPVDFSALRLRIDAFVTREQSPDHDGRKPPRTISFKPSTSSAPLSPVLGANSWLWLAAVTASSFLAYLLMLGLINRYYLYPIDKNTNKEYSFTAKALLNLLLMCVAIAATAGLAVVWAGRRVAEERGTLRVGHASTPSGTPAHYGLEEMSTELESFPGEALEEAATVHYGARPDLKKILMECKESNTGVFVSGPAALRRDVAAICASGMADNLHLESVSFTW